MIHYFEPNTEKNVPGYDGRTPSWYSNKGLSFETLVRDMTSLRQQQAAQVIDGLQERLNSIVSLMPFFEQDVSSTALTFEEVCDRYGHVFPIERWFDGPMEIPTLKHPNQGYHLQMDNGHEIGTLVFELPRYAMTQKRIPGQGYPSKTAFTMGGTRLKIYSEQLPQLVRPAQDFLATQQPNLLEQISN